MFKAWVLDVRILRPALVRLWVKPLALTATSWKTLSRVSLELRQALHRKPPSTGKPGIRLNSLRACTTGSSHTTHYAHEVTSVGPAPGPCGRRDEQAGPSIIFQGGRQGHQRPGAENIGVTWEPTCPPTGWPAGGVHDNSKNVQKNKRCELNKDAEPMPSPSTGAGEVPGVSTSRLSLIHI